MTALVVSAQVSHNGLEGPGHGPGHKGALPTSRRNSSLEINDGDQRYVVSYTLKASASGTPGGDRSKQHLRPDILNTPRGEARAVRRALSAASKRKTWSGYGTGQGPAGPCVPPWGRTCPGSSVMWYAGCLACSLWKRLRSRGGWNLAMLN